MDQNDGIAEYYTKLNLTKANERIKLLEQALELEKLGAEKLNQRLIEIDDYLTKALDLNCSNTTTILGKIMKLENCRRYGNMYQNTIFVSADEIAERLDKIRNED